jgi:hypothetical protein
MVFAVIAIPIFLPVHLIYVMRCPNVTTFYEMQEIERYFPVESSSFAYFLNFDDKLWFCIEKSQFIYYTRYTKLLFWRRYRYGPFL